MTLEEAQRDIRRAYVGGGPGAIISGIVWLVAAAVVSASGVKAGFIALFLGGMLIYPLGVLASRMLFRRTAEASGNRLGRTALESSIAMIGLFFAAWLFIDSEPVYVFPLAAIAVGTHYFVFRTVYGDAAYWVLGAAVSAIGFAGAYRLLLDAFTVAIAVGIFEIMFGFLLTMRSSRTAQT